MTDHGYNRYTRGCRCETCREAKAGYMRTRRRQVAAPRRLAQRRGERLHVDGIRHGTAGYNEHSCRCEVCVRAKKRTSWRQA